MSSADVMQAKLVQRQVILLQFFAAAADCGTSHESLGQIGRYGQQLAAAGAAAA
jgi:hypothetical protein